MSQTDETAAEIRRIRRLLKQMYQMAEHSSLTGALAGGATDVIQTYNLILTRLGELGVVSGPLFLALPQDASFDRLGVASKLLAGYLEEEAPASDVLRGVNNIHIGSIAGLEDIKDLGRLVRENLPEFLRARSAASSESQSGGQNAPESVPSTPDVTTAPAPVEGETPRSETPIPMPDFSR
jgi:hypothetical protein